MSYISLDTSVPCSRPQGAPGPGYLILAGWALTLQLTHVTATKVETHPAPPLAGLSTAVFLPQVLPGGHIGSRQHFMTEDLRSRLSSDLPLLLAYETQAQGQLCPLRSWRCTEQLHSQHGCFSPALMSPLALPKDPNLPLSRVLAQQPALNRPSECLVGCS